MRVKMVSVTYERKFALAKYESLHLAVSLWADLDESEDSRAATSKLQEQAREAVKAEAGRLQRC